MKNYQLTKLTSLLFFTLVCSAWRTGGHGGSGGGDVCFQNGKCLSLTEIGFRIQRNNEQPDHDIKYWVPTQEVVDELAKIISNEMLSF